MAIASSPGGSVSAIVTGSPVASTAPLPTLLAVTMTSLFRPAGGRRRGARGHSPPASRRIGGIRTAARQQRDPITATPRLIARAALTAFGSARSALSPPLVDRSFDVRRCAYRGPSAACSMSPSSWPFLYFLRACLTGQRLRLLPSLVQAFKAAGQLLPLVGVCAFGVAWCSWGAGVVSGGGARPGERASRAARAAGSGERRAAGFARHTV